MDYEQKLKSYQLLIEMTNKTTSTMESDLILQFILEGIISVLPFVNGGILYLYEEDLNLLKKVATVNIDYDNQYLYIKPGDNVSGKCFVNHDCLALNSKEIYIKYIDDKTFPDSFIKYPYSAMTCCLIVEGKALGAVTICNYEYEVYCFTEDDLELLKAAAQHAAITILKSQLIKKKDFYVKKLEESNRALEYAVDIQNNFMDIVLNSTGFDKILEYLKKVIHCKVSLFDVFFQLIYSTDRNVQNITLKQLIDENTLKKILDREHYDNIYYKNDKQYMVISPIVGQKKLFGFLLIILEDEQFDKKNEAIINHVSLILALEWLRQDEKTKSLSDFSNKFLEELLADSSKGNVSKYADQLGLLPGGYFCLSAFKCDFISNESTSFYVRRIIDIVKYISMKVIVFSRNDEIYIIFNSQEKNDTYLKNIDKIEDDILAINENIVISRGGIYQSVENISRSFHDIQLCKKLIVNYGLFPRKLDYSSLGIWQLLLKLDKEDLRNFAEDILSNLIRENNDKNKELFFTLKTYLANNKNIRASAKILDIHYNTMYFRIKKIEEILGRNLDDEKDLCDVQIAIEIMGQV